MGDFFGSPKQAVTPPPEKIGQITPTGTTEFGTLIDGQFAPTEGQTFQRTSESLAGEQFRLGQEALQLGVLGEIGGGLTDPRTAEDIRRITFEQRGGPLSEQLAGLPELAGVGEAGLPGGPTTLGGLTGGLRGGITTGLPGDFETSGAAIEEATFQRVASRLAPGFQNERDNLEQTLANQGIPRGSDAFDEELRKLDSRQNFILSDAAFGAVGAGRQEQERLARLGLATRGQEFGEITTQAGLGLSEAALQQQVRTQETQSRISREQLEQSIRGQLFGEREQIEQARLNRQLSLTSLEQQQRAQQFGELGALGGFFPTFSPTPIGTVSSGQFGQQAAGPGFNQLGGLLGSLFGGLF